MRCFCGENMAEATRIIENLLATAKTPLPGYDACHGDRASCCLIMDGVKPFQPQKFAGF
jgi:hypothetical protein